MSFTRVPIGTCREHHRCLPVLSRMITSFDGFVVIGGGGARKRSSFACVNGQLSRASKLCPCLASPLFRD